MSRSPEEDKNDFMQLHDWLKLHRDKLLTRIDRGKSERRIYNFLECILGADWYADNPSFDVIIEGIGEATLPPIATDVKKYLKIACDELNLGRSLVIGKIGKTTRYWIRWEGNADQNFKAVGNRIGFLKVFVVGNLRTGEWNHEIMRGVRSMARELEIELIDLMQRDWLKGRDLKHDSNPLLDIVRKSNIDPQHDSILVRNRDHNELGGNIDALRAQGYHVVTTGFANGMVRQNLGAVGMLLAQQCIEDQRRFLGNDGEGYVVVIHRYPDLEGNTTAIQAMQQSFRSTLDAAGARFAYPDFGETPYYGLNYAPLRKRYAGFGKKLIKEYGKDRLAAIFVPDESYGLAALHQFAQEQPDLCRVYCERLVRSLLETHLIEGARQIHAACGMEPYYFGRYALRAASFKREGGYEPADPVLLTIDDILLNDFTSPDRVPACFESYDVHYNQAKYAWHDSMKEKCGKSFGPDQFKKQKSSQENR